MKTLEGISGRNGQVEIEVTAAIVAALPTMTGVTPAVIDISGVVKSLKPSAALTRAFNKEYVIGDQTAIIDRDTRISEVGLDLVIVYENGKATYGAGISFDLYHDLLWPFFNYTASDLQLPIQWSPGGGEVGDRLFASDPLDTGISSIPLPPTDEAASSMIQMPIKLETPSVTSSIIV